MNADQIAYLALMVSVASLVVSFMTLYRDRHVVRVRAVSFFDTQGVCNLQVTVSNSGRRPISINHVLLRPPGHPGLYLAFAPNGQNQVDVGESKSCQISPIGLPISVWTTLEELHKCKVFVEDAIGKQHKARFSGKRGLLSWFK